MALMVSSIFSTWPCFTPLLLARPKPSISSLPYSFLRPAIQAILVVPMSSPTIIGCSLFIDYVVFSCSLISTLLHFHISTFSHFHISHHRSWLLLWFYRWFYCWFLYRMGGRREVT